MPTRTFALLAFLALLLFGSPVALAAVVVDAAGDADQHSIQAAAEAAPTPVNVELDAGRATPEGDPIMSKFHVKTRKGSEPFRRAGRTFSDTEQVIDSSELTDEQVASLRAEMSIDGSPLEVREEGGPDPKASGDKASTGGGDKPGSGEPSEPNTEDALNRQASTPGDKPGAPKSQVKTGWGKDDDLAPTSGKPRK